MASATTEAAEIRRRGRHRLIGAIAIVALLVIFVPMIFDREPATQPEPSLEIPAKDKAPPLPLPAKKAQAPQAVVPAQAGSQSPAPQAVAPAQAAARSPKLEGFAVQVGAFKDEDKLKQARDKLTAAGISHFVERRDTPGGP